MMTLNEVADRLFAEGVTPTRVTRERIRQIEAKALKKLRAACLAEGLSLADLLPEHMGGGGDVLESDE